LTIVSEAVAGEDLQSIARAASEALGAPVAIAVPAPGEPVVWPPSAAGAKNLTDTAAAVSALLFETGERALAAARVALLKTLLQGPPTDVDAFVERGRRVGLELEHGAVAIAVRGELPAAFEDQLAEVAPGRILGLVPAESAADFLGALTAAGVAAAASAARRDPVALHDGLREAELLLELGDAGREETFRLLIGVLLRDRGELERLRERTISPLSLYDAEHDTELLATLQAFLAHHGSTSETAEALGLHRHTVGYRLARAHEVCGLSPHESDGRERLGLGLKAHLILEADRRLNHEHE
jgi:hypothetical protein